MKSFSLRSNKIKQIEQNLDWLQLIVVSQFRMYHAEFEENAENSN